MKKTLLNLPVITLLIFQIISSCDPVFAQSIEVSGDAYVYGNPGMPIGSHIVVKNITTDTLGVMCEKIIIDTAAGTSNYFCWGTSCWPSSTYVSPIPAGVRLIPPGFGDSTNFVGYYDAFGNPARAVVKYCFYPQGNVADSSCLTIHYNDNVTSVIESERKTGLNDFYPNPSDNSTSIKYVAGNHSQLHIIDILGNTIKSFDLDYSGTLKIRTSDFSSGIYFGNLVIDKRVVSVKKLIIN